MQDAGVLYVATGEQYIDEAIRSARSLTDNTSGYPTTLISDREPGVDVFDSVQLIEPTDSFRDKIRLLKETPYSRTVFIDTDTYICGEIGELFSLLEEYEFAATHAPGRRPVVVEGVPESFPEYNTGVLCYNNCNKVWDFIEDWLKSYDQNERGTPGNDQPGFRRTLYGSGLELATFPPEYNCRTIWPGYVDGKVKIIHGRHSDFELVARRLNSSTEMRVFLPDGEDVVIYSRDEPSLSELILRRYRADGLRETLRRGVSHLLD